MVARDERDVFISAKFFEQRHELFWVGERVAAVHRFQLSEQTRRIQRLVRARDVDIENEDSLIRDAPVFLSQVPSV